MINLLDVIHSRKIEKLTIKEAMSKMNGCMIVDQKNNSVTIKLEGDKVKEFLSE